MKDIKAYINYDAIPSKNYKYQVEIYSEGEEFDDIEVLDYVSVMDDSEETVQKVLNEFKNEIK
jgi:hypothetical protein